jgi:hypothetical protein
MIRRWLTLAGLLLTPWLPVYSTPSEAWDLRTHWAITDQAVNDALNASTGLAGYLTDVGIQKTDTFDPAAATPQPQLAFFRNTGTPRDWMIEGVIREDDFTSSLLAWLAGCPQPRNPPTPINRPLNHFYDVQRQGGGITPCPPGSFCYPAPNWALGLQGRGPVGDLGHNYFTIPDARAFQLLSLTAPTKADRDKHTALLFRALGQVFHLVQDMSVPEHTRNDRHAGCTNATLITGEGSWFEGYIEQRALGRYASPLNLGGYAPPAITKYEDLWSTPPSPTGKGIADFSSRNFFSAGTNLSRIPFLHTCGGLSQPQCDPAAYTAGETEYDLRALDGTRVRGRVRQLFGTVRDPNTGAAIPNVPLSSPSILNPALQGNNIFNWPVYTLNRVNYDAMADLLLPRAVGYSVALLDYFFRGKLDFEVRPNSADPAQVDLVIWNNSKEAMTGAFTLYAENETGNRQPVPGASREAITLKGVEAPDWSTTGTQTITFTPDAAVPLAGLSLVFAGTLGAEPGAVVGKVQPEPLLFVIQEQAVLLAAEQSRTETPAVDGETGKLTDYTWATASTSRWREPTPQRLSGRFQTADGSVPDGVIDRVATWAGATLRVNGVEVGSEWSREVGPAMEPRTWEITVSGGGGLTIATRAGRTYAGPMVTWGQTSSYAESAVTYDYPYANSIGCDNPELYVKQFSKGTRRQAEVRFSSAFVPVGEVGGYAVGTSLNEPPAIPSPESGCPPEGVWTGRRVQVFANGSHEVFIGEGVEGRQWVDEAGSWLPPDPPPASVAPLASFTFRRQYSADELQWYQQRGITPPEYEVRLE